MAALEHILTLGQSLSVGSQGSPTISTVTEAANARLVNPTTGALTELKTSSGNQRPDLSMGYRIAQHMPGQVFGFSTHGVSGQTIAQLSKGGSSGRYEQAITAVQAAFTAQAGSSHVRELHWIQGEADQTFDTPASVYRSSLVQLAADYNADIRAITGQAGALPMIMSQTATWAYYGNAARIGLAQLDVARTLPNYYLVGGQYQLPYAEGLHLTAVGYYRLGELHARAANAVADGLGWAPFAPTLTELVGNTVVITFHVPTGSLEFDTVTVPAQPNFGFSLHGTTATITQVSITATNKVTLNLSKPITEAGAQVGYGISSGTGPGLGNLCDGETATSAYDGARIANWAAHFRDSLPVVVAPMTYWVADHMYYYDGASLIEITP